MKRWICFFAFFLCVSLPSTELIARKTKNHSSKIRRIRGAKLARAKRPTQGRLKTRQPKRRPVDQIMAHAFDWDDNVMHMPTQIHLIKNSTGKVHSFLPEEFASVRQDIGDGKTWSVDRDGPVFSFREFQDAQNPDQFLNDNIKGLSKNKWAPNAPAWQRWLANKMTARWAFVVTSRGHQQKSLKKGVNLWQQEGYIRYTMPAENLTGVDLPGGALVAGKKIPLKHTIDQRKNVVHKARLDEIQAHPIGQSAIDIISSNGKTKEKLHTYEFSDDDPGFANSTIQFFKENAKRWPNVKLVVTYTGKEKRKGFRRTVITLDGKEREYGKSIDGKLLQGEKTEVERSIASQQQAGIE